MDYTVDLLFSVEPQLKDVVDTAEFIAETTGDKDVAYVTAKRSSDRLVGFGAKNPELRNEGAYHDFI